MVEDCCQIHKYTDRQYGDRRLSSFLAGGSGPLDMLPQVQAAMKGSGTMTVGETDAHRLNFVIKEEIGQCVINTKGLEDITIVTAVDRKYLPYLKVSLPNWIKHKRLNQYPFLVYINGFSDLQDPELSFLQQHPDVTIKIWDFPQATSQRERMLSAFVLGTASDIKTPYWLKLDADSFASDDRELITEAMKKGVLCAHKWHYTKPWQWIQQFDEWAKDIPELQVTPPMFDPKNIDGRRYNHARIASYVCLHNSEFVRKAAALAGSRLPIPSHDSYLFYIAARLGLPVIRHNFKRHSGFSNWSDFEKLKAAVEKLK